MKTPQSNSYELNVLYNQRIKGVQSYILKLAKGDDDLIQEGYIGVYNAIKEKPDLKPSYLKAKAQWNIGSWTKIIIPNDRSCCHHAGLFCHS